MMGYGRTLETLRVMDLVNALDLRRYNYELLSAPILT